VSGITLSAEQIGNTSREVNDDNDTSCSTYAPSKMDWSDQEVCDILAAIERTSSENWYAQNDLGDYLN
jgi:hypothetical protein